MSLKLAPAFTPLQAYIDKAKRKTQREEMQIVFIVMLAYGDYYSICTRPG